MVHDEESEIKKDATLLTNATLLKSLNKQEARLLLIYQGKMSEIAPGPKVFVAGRSSDCDLVIQDKRCSRQHVRFVYRKGKFILVDHSTNGTFVRFQDQSEVCLVEQEQIPLIGSGLIGLGRSTANGADELIEFRCVYPTDQSDNTA